MAASSGSTTASDFSATSPSSTTRKVCEKHNAAELFMSRTDANPYRRFVRCPQRGSGCNFFEWVDGPMPDFQTSWVQRLNMRKQSLEDEVQQKKVVAELLAEKVKMKEAENAKLGERCADLEQQVKTCRRKLCFLKFGGAMIGLIAVFVIFCA